jgi:predicted MFS family arabinose efflux permease
VLPARLASAADAAGADPAQDGRLRDVVASPAFWVLSLLFLTPPLVAYLTTMQHALYFRSRGFSADAASAMLTAGGVLSTSGRILAGVVTDRAGAPAAGVLSFAISIAGLLCLIGVEHWPSRALAYASVLLVFLPIGSRATIVSVLVSRIASRAQYGPVFGLLGLSNSLGAGLGPVLSGAIYDRTRSYAAIYWVATALLVAGLGALVLFVAMTGPRARPVGTARR